MASIFRGRGILYCDQGIEYSVEFEFQVTHTTSRTPGLAPQVLSSNANGIVWPRDTATTLPEGYYWLHADDGSRTRVKNLGMTWTILSGV